MNQNAVFAAVIDDHPIFRDGLKSFLKSKKNISKVFEASRVEEFIDILRQQNISVAFMDISLPGKSGIEGTIEAVTLQPDIKIIGISSYENIEYIDQMMAAGARAYILKDASQQETELALEKVLAGEYYFSEKVLVRLSQRAVVKSESDVAVNKIPQISEREKDVLKLLCEGLSRFEIADKLSISERTVDKHRENLQQKTGMNTSVKLVLYALKNKLVVV